MTAFSPRTVANAAVLPANPDIQLYAYSMFGCEMLEMTWTWFASLSWPRADDLRGP